MTRDWVAADLDRWSSNEPLRALVARFGGNVPEGDTPTKLAYLANFSSRHWDFRKGKERDFIENVEFGADVDEVVLETARLLGMRGSTTPSLRSYDHLLILGGLVRACLLRPRYAADLIRGGVAPGTVAALTAYRPLSETETRLLAQLGIAGSFDDEVDVMQAGLVAAFDLHDRGPASSTGSAGDASFATWLDRRWEGRPVGTHAAPVRLVVAPSPSPAERRANTADTYDFWAKRGASLRGGDRVLLVTSAIYVPFQGCDAVRVLGLEHGVSVETVGIDNNGAEHGLLRQTFRPAHYLQEIRSTIRSVGALYNAATTTV